VQTGVFIKFYCSQQSSAQYSRQSIQNPVKHRLVINPGTPQSWEIQLKDGINRIGRREGNDHVIEHGSISGSHCEIHVSDGKVILKDLGSTNGTFVNKAPVQEATLQSGQHLQFGNVDMIFESDGVGAPPAAPSAPAPAKTPGPVRLNIPKPAAAPAAASSSEPPVAPRIPQPSSIAPTGGPPRLSISGHKTAAAPAAVAEPAAERVEGMEEPPAAPDVPVRVGAAFCKSHIKSPARFHCPKCNHYFCDLCVTNRPGGGGTGKFCRKCGGGVKAVQATITRAKPKSFFAQLPGAFGYPFRGSGILILIVSTIVFSLLQGFVGIFTILLSIMAVGYLFTYMQNIIYATAAEEKEMPDLPAFDDLFGAAFRLAGTIIVSFGIPIAVVVMQFFSEENTFGAAIMPTIILGCLYFPMAFLAVAMKDTVLAANPLVVIPAILKIPFQYLIAAVLLSAVYGIRMLGDSFAGDVGDKSMMSKSMGELFMGFGVRAIWSFISVYLLVVNMRILGLLYVANKQKLGWFKH
jgi:pSer/pThr/pTyr-binding forkhead associated (FHA) protein